MTVVSVSTELEKTITSALLKVSNILSDLRLKKLFSSAQDKY